MGGASVIQQALDAGLVDSVHLHIAPIVLGAGIPLFDNLTDRIELERTEVVMSKFATHLRFRVIHTDRPARAPAGEGLAQPRLADSGLQGGRVATRLPAQDLDRARRFYAEKLGLQPDEERPGGLRYQCREGWFALFESSGRPSGSTHRSHSKSRTSNKRCVNCAPAAWCSKSTTRWDFRPPRASHGSREPIRLAEQSASVPHGFATVKETSSQSASRFGDGPVANPRRMNVDDGASAMDHTPADDRDDRASLHNILRIVVADWFAA
jgi:catechol 2,3-dioxygenase-like lactoylglutathione lyase family enzyme